MSDPYDNEIGPRICYDCARNNHYEPKQDIDRCPDWCECDCNLEPNCERDASLLAKDREHTDD